MTKKQLVFLISVTKITHLLLRIGGKRSRTEVLVPNSAAVWAWRLKPGRPVSSSSHLRVWEDFSSEPLSFSLKTEKTAKRRKILTIKNLPDCGTSPTFFSQNFSLEIDRLLHARPCICKHQRLLIMMCAVKCGLQVSRWWRRGSLTGHLVHCWHTCAAIFSWF